MQRIWRVARGPMMPVSLMLVASILLPAILFAVTATQLHEQEVRQTRDTVDRAVAVLQVQMRNVFDVFNLAFDRIEDRLRTIPPEDIPSSEAVHSFLAGMTKNQSQLGTIFVVGRTGRVVNSSTRFPVDVDVSDRSYMRAFAEGVRGTIVTEPMVGRVTGIQAFGVARPLLDADGEFAGALIMTADPAYFRQYFSRMARNQTFSAGLIREDGTFLVRASDVASTREPRASEAFMRSLARNPNEGEWVGLSAVDGVERIAAYKRVEGYPVYAMFALATHSVWSSWRQLLLLYGVFAVPAWLGLIGASVLLWVRTRRERLAAARLQEEMVRRQATEARLSAAERMEALGQLTGGVAHDFNNLMTVLMGNLDMLRRATPDRQKRLIENGLRAVEQGRRLTQQLLAFARRQPLQPLPLDINSQIRGMSDMLTQSLRGDIRLEFQLAPNLWPVHADPTQLQTTLINLAANARDALPKGGRLVIETRNVAHAADVGQAVCIAVRDNGVGMSRAVQDRVFDPFFTTKPPGRGTGLGLSQVYGFVRQTGGTVHVDSLPDRGTTVTILLPRSSIPVPVPVDAEPPRTPANEGRSLRILMVEDNAAVAEVGAQYLREAGHDPVWVGSVADAVAELERETGFDLVFSDLVMPGGADGLELARQVRHRWPHLPVLLATGYSDAAARARADGFPLLSKPYSASELAESVRRAAAGAALDALRSGRG